MVRTVLAVRCSIDVSSAGCVSKGLWGDFFIVKMRLQFNDSGCRAGDLFGKTLSEYLFSCGVFESA